MNNWKLISEEDVVLPPVEDYWRKKVETIRMEKKSIFSDIIILPALLGILVFVMTLNSPVTAWEGYKFYFCVIFSVLIPGISVYRLLRIPEFDTLDEVVCGYGLGYVLIIIQYFFLAACRMLHLFSCLQFVTGGIAVIFLLLSPRRENIIQKSDIKKDWCPLICLIFLVFAIRYFVYYGLNILPSSEQNVTFPTQDILFYIGNAISAKKGIPLEEFRFSGQIFKYHYLGSIYLGATSLLTGIDTLRLEVCLQWIQPVILIVSSFYILMRRMKIRQNLCFGGMILLLFTAGRESLVYVTYQHILYTTPFGFDLGMAMGILFVLYLYIQHSLQKFHCGIFIITLLSFFACEGTKAPIAVVMLFFAGTVCSLWLISLEKRKWAFIYGISLVLIFLVVFLGIISDGMNTVTTNASGLHFSLTGHLYECGLGKLYFEWAAQGIPGWLGKIIVLVMYFVGCNIAVYCLLAIFVSKIIHTKARCFFSFDGCILSAIVFGLVFTLITKQTGNSQMYFAMAAFPMAVLLSIKLWNQFESLKERSGKKLFYGVVCFLFLAGVVSFVQILAPSLLKGHEKLTGKDTCNNVSNSLTYAEAEAYEWVRNNTPDNALCVTNVILDDAQFESFIVGVCTERQMYMEGWRYVTGYLPDEAVMQRRDLIRDFFEGKETASEEILKADVDYIIWVKRYAEKGQESNCPGIKVFENSDISIYKFSR